MMMLILVLVVTYFVPISFALRIGARWSKNAINGHRHGLCPHPNIYKGYGTVEFIDNSRLSMSVHDRNFESDDDYETSLEVSEEGVVYKRSKAGIPLRKVKTDDRDNLPYKTYILLDGKARNAEHIATLRLGALTACGDILDLGEKGLYEVVRVSFVYKWEVSGFAVTGKRLYCKPARRMWARSLKSLQ